MQFNSIILELTASAVETISLNMHVGLWYRGADKSLARPGRKQATATEDFEFHISYLLSKLEEY